MLLFCGSVLEKYGETSLKSLHFQLLLCNSVICVLMENVMEKNVKMEQVEKTIQVFRIMFTVSVQKLKTNHRVFSQTGLSLQTLLKNNFSMQFLQLLCLSPKAEGKELLFVSASLFVLSPQPYNIPLCPFPLCIFSFLLYQFVSKSIN